MNESKTALVTGVGPGLGTSICGALAQAGFFVAALSRSEKPHPMLVERLKDSRWQHYACDVSDTEAVNKTVAQAREQLGPINVLVHNASSIAIQSFSETPVQTFEDMWRVTCLGAVNCAQAVLQDMQEAGSGSIILTGATAALRGGKRFSAFASAKFALRGLGQSLARELGPEGIHVSHVIIDGLIWGEKIRERFNPKQVDCLDPDEIAAEYVKLVQQDRSAWTQELDLRPFSETF